MTPGLESGSRVGSPTKLAAPFDPFSPGWREDPYPKYRELRDEAPVHWSPEARAFCVSRHEDVMTVLKDSETFSSRAMFSQLMNGGYEKAPPWSWNMLRFVIALMLKTRLNPSGFASARNLIAEDGKSHAQMRNIVNRGFTPRSIAGWEPRIHDVVDECLAGLRDGAPFDAIADLAVPLPVTIIAELLGVESHRHADFKRWSNCVIEGTTGPGRNDLFGARYRKAFIEIIRYLKRVARDRRRNPKDDLVSTILASQGELGLNDREVIQFGLLLLVAGNETTTNLIGNAVNALLEHPEELSRLTENPALVPAALEETLRWDAPIQLLFRNATRDCELSGVRVPAGSIVIPLLGSANRDERRFPDPDRFDLNRNPQGHVGFGFGEHFCLGASLARLEAQIALEALVPHLTNRVRPKTAPEFVDSFLVRGRASLPLERAA